MAYIKYSSNARLTTNYDEINIIGNGAYGTVYKARDNRSGDIVALKKVRIALSDDGVPMSTVREISLLKQIDAFKHPNIVKLLDVCHGQRLEREGQLILYMVFEHLEQDLDGYMKKLPQTGMSRAVILKFSRQLLSGIEFLHSHRIVHRDLKPQNLLISCAETLKLADFGLAKTYDFEMKLTSIVVTLWYRAPEILLGQSYDSAVDIWSAACIIAEMYSRKALFPGTSEGNQLERIFELTGRPAYIHWPRNVSIVWDHFPPLEPKMPRDLCPKLCDSSNELLTKMLAFEPSDRPTAHDCLTESAYFTDEPLL